MSRESLFESAKNVGAQRAVTECKSFVHGRRRCRKSSPSTPEVLSTSPETPTKDDPNFRRPTFVAAGLPSDIAASDHVTKIVGSAATTKTTVRENPMHGLPLLQGEGGSGGDSLLPSRTNLSVGLHNYRASTPLDHPSPDDDAGQDVGSGGAAGVDWDRMVKPRPRQHRVAAHCPNQNLALRQGGLTGQGAVRGCTSTIFHPLFHFHPELLSVSCMVEGSVADCT